MVISVQLVMLILQRSTTLRRLKRYGGVPRRPDPPRGYSYILNPLVRAHKSEGNCKHSHATKALDKRLHGNGNLLGSPDGPRSSRHSTGSPEADKSKADARATTSEVRLRASPSRPSTEGPRRSRRRREEVIAPQLTDEQVRDAFLVGQHVPPKRPERERAFDDISHEARAAYRKRALAERGLSVKWYMIMTMQMRGLTNIEISVRLGIKQTTLSTIQKTEKYRKAFEARMSGLDQEILALKPKAIEALSAALVDQNKETALRASKQFFEMTGQGTYGKNHDPAASGAIGAVQLARALLAESRTSVTINNTVQVGVTDGSQTVCDGRLAEGAEAPQHVRSLHAIPSGRVLRGSQGECGSSTQAGDESRGEPQGVEDHRLRPAQEQYEQLTLDYQYPSSHSD